MANGRNARDDLFGEIKAWAANTGRPLDDNMIDAAVFRALGKKRDREWRGRQVNRTNIEYQTARRQVLTELQSR